MVVGRGRCVPSRLTRVPSSSWHIPPQGIRYLSADQSIQHGGSIRSDETLRRHEPSFTQWQVSPSSCRWSVSGGGTYRGEPIQDAGRSADGDKPGVASWPGAVSNPGCPMSFPGKGDEIVGYVQAFVHRPGSLPTKPSPSPSPPPPSRRRPILDGEENRKRCRAMILNICSRFGV